MLKGFLLSILLFVYEISTIKAGCGGVKFTFDNLHSYYSYPSPPPAFCRNTRDSLYVVIKQVGSCSAPIIKQLIFNNTALPTPTTNYFNLLCTPGNYTIIANIPALIDTYVMHFSIYDCALVGINETENYSNTISLFPNPATNLVFLSNETEIIRFIKIYNSEGQLVSNLEVNDVSAQISIENLARGFYFIEVATLSKKTVLKKLLVN